jgi:hypothetical protein
MNKEELIEALLEGLSIEIERDQNYYSYPHLSVRIMYDNVLISESTCTIYDGDCHGQ